MKEIKGLFDNRPTRPSVNPSRRPIPLENGTQWNQFAEAGRTKPNEHSLRGTNFFFWCLT